MVSFRSILDFFLLGIPINVIGVLYIIFGLKEVERESVIELKAVDNPNAIRDNDHPVEKKSKGFLRDFFDPTMIFQCIKVIIKKRKYGEQVVIIFLIILYSISAGAIQGRFHNVA